MIHGIASRELSPPLRRSAALASSAPSSAHAPEPVDTAALTAASADPACVGSAADQKTASAVASAALGGPAGVLLKVLSLNMQLDGTHGVDNIASLIRTTGADLVGLQESVRHTRELAQKLGMSFVQQNTRTALLSRFPITQVSPKKYAVAVQLPSGREVGFANAHLTSFPYQPHQLCHLPGGGGPYLNTEAEAVQSADRTRGNEVRTMLREVEALGLPTVGTGDFNEPSHLDWTQRAADAGRNPLKVEWPASKQFAEAGFGDSYRQLFPDELTHPGHTWTPTTAPDDPNDHHDRIDFVRFRGAELQLKSVQVVGESPQFADIVVQPYPSDHRGVLATFEVAPPRA